MHCMTMERGIQNLDDILVDLPRGFHTAPYYICSLSVIRLTCCQDSSVIVLSGCFFFKKHLFELMCLEWVEQEQELKWEWGSSGNGSGSKHRHGHGYGIKN
jgi:hypothetical protein